MEELKTEKWVLEDGRRAERRVVETVSADGHSEKVIELHIEDERPLRLQQRVVEKTKPVICERKIEVVDPHTGNVIEQKVESLEPKSNMQLVDHIVSNNVSAQATEDCHVTREEMVDTIVAAIKAAMGDKAQPDSTLAGKLKTLGLADEIAGKATRQGLNASDAIMYVVIAALLAGLGYILFFM